MLEAQAGQSEEGFAFKKMKEQVSKNIVASSFC